MSPTWDKMVKRWINGVQVLLVVHSVSHTAYVAPLGTAQPEDGAELGPAWIPLKDFRVYAPEYLR